MENLCRVAGTGAYGKFLGRQLSGNSRLLRHVLETKTEKVVTQSRFDTPFAKVAIVKKIAVKKHFWVRLSFYRIVVLG